MSNSGKIVSILQFHYLVLKSKKNLSNHCLKRYYVDEAGYWMFKITHIFREHDRTINSVASTVVHKNMCWKQVGVLPSKLNGPVMADADFVRI